MPPVPLWLALLGLSGNAVVFAVLFFRGDPWWPLFLLATIISLFTSLRAKQIAVRTAESHDPCSSTDSTPSS